MDIKEIRIGNKVVWEGEIKTIDGIKINRQYGISAMQFLEDCKESPYIENRKWYAMDRLSSIPLTEGWLIRMGFKYDQITYSKEYAWLASGETGYDVWLSGLYHGMHTHVSYVHQLQNLWFALMGTELIIK